LRELDEPRGSSAPRLHSELSEEAWYAGWMIDLEYALWDAVERGPRSYGRLLITEEHIARLRQLAAACGGWIQFGDDAPEEKFVPLDAWKRLAAERAADPSRPAV